MIILMLLVQRLIKVKTTKLTLEAEKERRWIAFFAPRTTAGNQVSIIISMKFKEMVDNAKLAFAKWWYDANILFNSSKSMYY